MLTSTENIDRIYYLKINLENNFNIHPIFSFLFSIQYSVTYEKKDLGEGHMF